MCLDTKTFKNADLLVAYTVSAVVQVQQVDNFIIVQCRYVKIYKTYCR